MELPGFSALCQIQSLGLHKPGQQVKNAGKGQCAQQEQIKARLKGIGDFLRHIHAVAALIVQTQQSRWDNSCPERRRFFFLVANAPAVGGVFRAESCGQSRACRSKASRKTVGSSLPRA